MAYIYCITNSANQKKYVGKTNLTLEKRFQEHCRDSRKERTEKRPLHDAMRKYGVDCFSIDLLEECEDNCVSDKEITWIKKLETFGKGYNATLGGEGSVLYDYDLIADTYKQGLTCVETAEKIGCCLSTVYDVLAVKNIDANINAVKRTYKAIKQLDLNGVYIRTFKSVMEALEWLFDNGFTKSKNNNTSGNLGRCANGKAKTAFKFKWEWEIIN